MNEPKQISPAAQAIMVKAFVFAIKKSGGREQGWKSRQQHYAQLYCMADEQCKDEAEKEKMVDDWKDSPWGEALAFFGNASANAQTFADTKGKDGLPLIVREGRAAKKVNPFAGFDAAS